ncbi:hypothetical protein HU200_066058 [Digitaria exilis]|uniref:Uncharacterized protein n=1 Tax=Digitaria exilis TaxID=1010633 RepID=A0A835A0V3_9POAL|nr:hypothetical protein HU200_066058 [Digitaria exilis]
MLKQAKVLQEDGSVVDSTLRRSDRPKLTNRGFKASSCTDKKCFGCEMNPPTLSTSIIKNLGKDFCKIDPTKLKRTGFSMTKTRLPVPL